MRHVLAVLLLTCFAFGAKTERVSEDIVAQKNGDVIERMVYKGESAYMSRTVTNYILHVSTLNERMILTIRCRGRGCFELNAGQSYPAVFEYHRGKTDFVWIIGQPGGNLTKAVSMKSAVVNWEPAK
jgi:hypothetical protein